MKAKPGNGIEQLRDDDIKTYWQSDGAHPHLINVQFLKKVAVSKIAIYLDFIADGMLYSFLLFVH